MGDVYFVSIVSFFYFRTTRPIRVLTTFSCDQSLFFFENDLQIRSTGNKVQFYSTVKHS